MMFVSITPCLGMTKEDLSKSTTFSLTESQTITLLHIASSCVATDDPKLMSIKAKNTQYAELCASKDGTCCLFRFVYC